MSRMDFPKIAHLFFRWYCKKSMYEELHGDLEEFFYERVEEKGLLRARLWYVLDVIRCFQPYAWKNFSGQTNSNIAMFKNYYITTIRNLARHKSYFIINTLGLAIGITSFVFISLYVIHVLSYDRFHTNHENTFRVSSKAVINGLPNQDATTAAPMAQTLLENYPEVVKATRIVPSKSLLVGREGIKINEDGVLYAEETFFDVFDFKLVKGNPQTALVHPRSIVLSESYAFKYFGYEDPMGKKLTIEEDTTFYTVTGIVEDAPANSHIHFDMIGSISSNDFMNRKGWIGGKQHTYVVLNAGADVAGLEEKMGEILFEYMAPEIEYYTGLSINEWVNAGAGNSVNYELTPIAEIHLYSIFDDELQATGNVLYVYIYSIVGFIILFIAVFNFVNLATAHSATRAKEVGVRKVIGSSKRNLMGQFIFESVLVSMLATLIAIILVSTFKPSFVELIGQDLAYGIGSTIWGWLAMIVLAMMVGILAGIYPAFVLSSFKPSEVIKGTHSPGKQSGWLRNSLVTIQFVASIVIIIGTLVIYQQIDFMLSKHLGFDKEQILVVKRPDGLTRNLEVFKEDLLTHPNINMLTNSLTIPGKNYKIRSYRKLDDPQVFLLRNNQINYDYSQLMGFEMVAGRFFSTDFGADSSGVVINETAARLFGYDDPIGQNLISAFRKGETLKIIGVIKDYNIESLHEQVAPVSMELAPDNNQGYISIKMSSSQNVRETVGYVQDTWDQYAAGKPLQYFFFDQDYENLYKSESTTGRVLLVFAALSIFVACLGLVGLVSFSASVRKKEIGIRKVLGAGVITLIKLLSSQTLKLICLATIISWPIAYWATQRWLANFADRVAFNPWMYLVATFALIVIVALVVSFRTLKTALVNPVDSLRQE